MNSGLGSPTFFFYAPIPYFVTSLIYPLVPNDPFGWLPVGLCASVASLASGLAAYAWLRHSCRPAPAFIAAALYIILPYHLATDHFLRFAFGEYWAFVWMPLVLLFTRRVTDGRRYAVAGLAVSYALLIMTHLPTTLVFSLVPCGLALASALVNARPVATLGRFTLGMALGIGIAAVYLLPAMTTQDNASLSVMTDGNGMYSNHFLFSTPERLSVFSDTFYEYAVAFARSMQTTLLTTTAIAACGVALAFLDTKESRRREDIFWLLTATVALFMMSAASKPIWQWVPLLQKIQFPWRIGTVLTVAATALVAHGIDALRKPVRWWSVSLLAALFGIVGYVGLETAKSAYWNVARGPAGPLERRQVIDYGEYRPRQVPRHVFTVDRMRNMGENLPAASVVSGDGTVVVEEWRPRRITLTVEAATDVLIDIKQLYYAGWVAKLRDGSQSFDVSPSTDAGLVSFGAPRGNYRVILTLDRGLEERAGQIVSVLSIGILVFWSLRRHASRQPAPSGQI
jgi:hypothetical protein